VTSQREIWDSRYQQRVAEGLRAEPPTELAERIASLLTRPSDVLELGCGRGSDAAYFAGLGHRVMATDFSDALIGANRKAFEGATGLSFRTLDISEAIDLPPASYDLVYARLSLHYFDDATTRRIFEDVARVLRPGGLLAFMCKSTDDRLYGEGVEVGPDMFESHHVRHFFSEAYARDVLAGRFEVQSVEARSGLLYGEPSAWIEAVARVR
jgi:SAM-dependent methyltransferase